MMKKAVEYRRRTAKRHQEEFFRKLRWRNCSTAAAQDASRGRRGRVQRLKNGANNWHRARRRPEYVLALVECRKKQEKELGPDTALGRWTTWALQQADRIDPLTESPTSILDRKKNWRAGRLIDGDETWNLSGAESRGCFTGSIFGNLHDSDASSSGRVGNSGSWPNLDHDSSSVAPEHARPASFISRIFTHNGRRFLRLRRLKPPKATTWGSECLRFG